MSKVKCDRQNHDHNRQNYVTMYSGWNWYIPFWETTIVYACTAGMQPRMSHCQDSSWLQRLWSKLLS